jgi:AcrR family transcriptional regulator
MARPRDLAGHRLRLSAATWSVLAEQGLTGLTLRAVAERAGCSTGLVLHTFPDKRALLVHARTLLHERTAARADAVQAAGGEPAAVLRRVLVEAACIGADKQAEARVWVGFLAAALADAELAALHRTHNRAFLRRLDGLLAACRPEWPGPHRARAAAALVALVEGLNALATVDPVGYPAGTQRAAIDAALASWLAPEPLGGRRRAP